MIYIQAEDQEIFLKSIGLDRINDVEYVTVDRDDHRIEWQGLHGCDGKHQYEIIRLIDFYSIVWYRDNKIHRDRDLPAVIYSDGYQAWWVNGERHREDGPAIIYSDGSRSWWVNGERHREDDLPAVIRTDGYQEWWVNNEFIRNSSVVSH